MWQFLANASKSLTLWANLAMAVLGVLTAIMPIFPSEQFPKVALVLMLATTVLNVLIRVLKTSTPIIPGPEPAPTPPVDMPEWALWIRDLLDALARKEIPKPEAAALAQKVLDQEIDGAATEGAKVQ